MRDRYQPRLCRVLEGVVTTPGAHQISTVCNDVTYQISAVHITSLWSVLVVTITTEEKLSILYLPAVDVRCFARR